MDQIIGPESGPGAGAPLVSVKPPVEGEIIYDQRVWIRERPDRMDQIVQRTPLGLHIGFAEFVVDVSVQQQVVVATPAGPRKVMANQRDRFAIPATTVVEAFAKLDGVVKAAAELLIRRLHEQVQRENQKIVPAAMVPALSHQQRRGLNGRGR